MTIGCPFFNRKRDRLLKVRIQSRPGSHSRGSEQLRPQSARSSVSCAELLLPAPGGGSHQGEETGAASRRDVSSRFPIRNSNELLFFSSTAAVPNGHSEEWGPTTQPQNSLCFDHLHQQSGSTDAQTWWVTCSICQITLKSLTCCIIFYIKERLQRCWMNNQI